MNPKLNLQNKKLNNSESFFCAPAYIKNPYGLNKTLEKNVETLDKYHRSNQDTCLVHKSAVKIGEWVESGDLLADNSASMNGELAIGKNILVAYMPWEGYNYEDAILINERLVYDDVYTSIHIERYEIETKENQLGAEQITCDIPDLTPQAIAHLDTYGIASIGSWIEEGDILVGKITPINKKSQTSYQRLLYKLLDKNMHSVRDSSLRAPKGIKANVINVQILAAVPQQQVPIKKKVIKPFLLKPGKDFINIDLKNQKHIKKNKIIYGQNPINYAPTTNYRVPNLLLRHSKTNTVLQPSQYQKTFLDALSGSMLHIEPTGLQLFKNKLGFISQIFSKKNQYCGAQMSYGHQISYQKKKVNSKFLIKKELWFKVCASTTHSCFYLNNKQLSYPINSNGTINSIVLKHKQPIVNSSFASLLHIEPNFTLSGGQSPYCPPAFIFSTYLYSGALAKKIVVIKAKSFYKSKFKSTFLLGKEQVSLNSKLCVSTANSVEPFNIIGLHLQKPILYNAKTKGMRLQLLAYKQAIHFDMQLTAYKKPVIKNISMGFFQKALQAKSIFTKLSNKTSFISKNFPRRKIKEKIVPTSVHIYLAEKRKIQIGDKMAGRHGNKGIISNILPRQDMPYLPDGTAIDIVLNPLGVPSRMNVGQIYECLLGLAGKFLGEHYKIFPFDEIYGAEASRSFVFAKLFEARKKTGIEWLFDPNSPGKIRLFDGRTGECFDQPVTIGIAYMLKLVHMVDDKIHARSTGPYSLVTQQPLRGRAKQGGQRLGEMEVWAIEGYGAAFVLLEMLTLKSDDMTGRLTLWSNLILNKEITVGTPESFKVLVCELQALCLDIGLFHLRSNSGIDSIAQNSKEPKTFSLKEISHLMLLP